MKGVRLLKKTKAVISVGLAVLITAGAAFANVADKEHKKSVVVVNGEVSKQAAAEDGVILGNGSLEAEVREIINKPEGPLYQSDLDKITYIEITNETKPDTGWQWINLTGLELMPNLTALSIQLTDECLMDHLAAIRKLPQLKVLRIRQLQPTYWSPKDLDVVSSLNNLQELYLTNIRTLQDISAVATLTGLKKLELSFCGIKDIAPLAALENLEELNLTGNEIKELTPLQKLKQLTSLYLRGNDMDDYSSLANRYKDYINKDFTLEKTPAESGNAIKFHSRDTEAMLRIMLDKTKGAVTVEDLAKIKDISMSVYFNSYLHNDLYVYDLQDLGLLANLESLKIEFERSTDFINIEALGQLTKLQKLRFVPYAGELLSDITPFGTLAHMKDLDVPFTATKKNIDTLKNMSQLEIVRWPYGYEDLTVLRDLKNLRELTVQGAVRDFSVLSKLPKLETLHLGRNPGSSGSSLAACKNIKYLDIYNFGDPFTDTSFLRGMTGLERLRINHAGLKNIKDIGGLYNLKELDLRDNEISDIAPLEKLKKLEKLSLSANKISKLEPLKALSKLKELDASSNVLKDVSPLAQMKNLESLELSNNWLGSLQPLEKLTNLKKLSLTRCGLTDISILGDLTQLKDLDLSLNIITDITPLQNLKQLRVLDAGLNKITDISALKDMSQLRDLRVCYNQIENIAPLAGLSKLEKVDFSFNAVKNLMPLAGLKYLEELDTRGNPIMDFTLSEELAKTGRVTVADLYRPGFVFGDAEETSTTAFWNGKKIPCIKINQNYAIAIEDLNYYGYNVQWKKQAGENIGRWYAVYNPVKSVTGAAERNTAHEALGKAMYGINTGMWNNSPIVIAGVNSKAYILADMLTGYGFDVSYDREKDVLTINQWDK